MAGAAGRAPAAQPQKGGAAVKQQVHTTYVEQEWQKVETKSHHADLDWAAAEGDESEEWECVACRKTFRSEAAWDSHERSKKHMKEVEKLRREMEDEDEDLGLDTVVAQPDEDAPDEDAIRRRLDGDASLQPDWDRMYRMDRLSGDPVFQFDPATDTHPPPPLTALPRHLRAPDSSEEDKESEDSSCMFGQLSLDENKEVRRLSRPGDR